MSERPQDPAPGSQPEYGQPGPGQPGPAQPGFQQYPVYPQAAYPPPVYPQPVYSPYPGYPPPYGYGYPGYLPQEPPPPNHLGWAIGAIFLFWPVAIAALIKSGQVERFWAMGQPELARQASESTRTLCLVATLIGAFTFVLGFVMFFVVLNSFRYL
nr:CD225/dispanin family protein [Kibdelosporangium sp. MJ126-NF4]CEL21188.1 hypothetical protein [Kibdelosporangium sp. MJ126-NF4]CTQ96246.1 hypothetical protein [Kibdelosporangium sp. MJ126-NF4]